MLAGCAGGGGGQPGVEPTSDVAQASCMQVGESSGEGYAGHYVETTWTISASGTASGGDGSVPTVVARPQGHSVNAWHGDAVVATDSWQPYGEPPGRTARREAGDSEQTAWTVSGIRVSHTDYDGLGDDDVVSLAYSLEAAVADPDVTDLARDAMPVVCS